MENEKLTPGKLYKIKFPSTGNNGTHWTLLGNLNKTQMLLFSDATTDPYDFTYGKPLYLNDEETDLFNNHNIPLLFLNTIWSYDRYTGNNYKLIKFCVFDKIFYIEATKDLVTYLEEM